ncbi:cytochrome P450 [Trametes polyzona]|nr:cytochrome P450 [Trametes polyzona]
MTKSSFTSTHSRPATLQLQTSYMTPLQEVLAAIVVSYIAWRLYVASSPTNKSVWDNLPGPKPRSFLTGHTEELFGQNRWVHEEGFVKQYGSVFRVHGPLGAKWIYTFDPRALHSAFIKDPDVFEEIEVLLAAFNTILGPGLLSTLGSQHRRQRKMLNPLFSAKHLRGMTPIFNQVVGQLRAAIASRLKDGPRELDLLEWTGRTALELIGQGGLGYSFDPLTRDVADDFASSLKAYFPTIQQMETFGPSCPWR